MEKLWMIRRGGGRGGEVAEIIFFHKQFFRDWSGTIYPKKSGKFFQVSVGMSLRCESLTATSKFDCISGALGGLRFQMLRRTP